MWVVKLGGSLLSGNYLRSWIDVLARSRRALVVVPGGGVFADQVRTAQRRWDLHDDTAHRMAILAMEQMAHLLCDLEPRLGRLVDTAALDRRPCSPGAQVWFPAAFMLADDSIPRSWDVTSDSLAAILARRLGADGLVLVKSAPLEGVGGQVLGLQSAGLVDGAFHRFGTACGCPVWLVGRNRSGDLSRLLQGRGESVLNVEFSAAAGAGGPSRSIPVEPPGLARRC
jgi:aspartokinase-like uncharacterized kinase